MTFHSKQAVVFLLCFLLTIVKSQELREPAAAQDRCSTGCISPGACQHGYFYRRHWMSGPFPTCCYSYDVGYRKGAESGLERLLELDCRSRQERTLYVTEARDDVAMINLSFMKFRGLEALRTDFLQDFPRLKVLQLASSYVKYIPDDFLSDLRDLEHIYLGYNQISEVPEDMFQNNQKLVKIDLSGNRIASIPLKLFDHTPHVEAVILAHNRLTYLRADHFSSLPDLRHLDMRNNMEMQCINPYVFANNPKISYVQLEKTGHRIHRSLQRSFCAFFCDGRTIADLRWQMTIYRMGRYQMTTHDQC